MDAEAVALLLQRVVEVAVVAVQLPRREDSAVRRQLLLQLLLLRFRPYLLRMGTHPMPTREPPLRVVAVVDSVVVAEEAQPRQLPPVALPRLVVEVRLPQQPPVLRFRSRFTAHVNKRFIPFLRQLDRGRVYL